MNRKQYDEALTALVFYAIVAPAVILLGMYVVGSFLDAFLHTTNTFSYIFTVVGGIPLIVLYYKQEWDRLMNRRGR